MRWYDIKLTSLLLVMSFLSVIGYGLFWESVVKGFPEFTIPMYIVGVLLIANIYGLYRFVKNN